MRGRKRNTVDAGYMNDERSSRFGGESVHRLQFHHTMTERANNAPPARGSSRRHRCRA